MAELELVGPIAQTVLNDLLSQRTRELISRCDGVSEAGMPELASESRFIANALLDTLAELETERSIRRAVQGRCDHLQAILGKATYEACISSL